MTWGAWGVPGPGRMAGGGDGGFRSGRNGVCGVTATQRMPHDLRESGEAWIASSATGKSSAPSVASAPSCARRSGFGGPAGGFSRGRDSCPGRFAEAALPSRRTRECSLPAIGCRSCALGSRGHSMPFSWISVPWPYSSWSRCIMGIYIDTP
jgi:hypothetical protein